MSQDVGPNSGKINLLVWCGLSALGGWVIRTAFLLGNYSGVWVSPFSVSSGRWNLIALWR